MAARIFLRVALAASVIHCSTAKPDGYLQEMTSVSTVEDAPEPRCPDGFSRIADKCFHVSRSTADWYGAVDGCHKLGAKLGYVDNDFEKYSLLALVKLSKGVSHYWFGGQSIHSHHNKWTWYATGKRLPYLSWCLNEPNEPLFEHCLRGSAPQHGCFHNDRCEKSYYHYVCLTWPTN